MTNYKNEAVENWYRTMRLKYNTDDDGVRAHFGQYSDRVEKPRGFAANKKAAKQAGLKGAQARWKDHKKKEDSEV